MADEHIDLELFDFTPPDPPQPKIVVRDDSGSEIHEIACIVHRRGWKATQDCHFWVENHGDSDVDINIRTSLEDDDQFIVREPNLFRLATREKRTIDIRVPNSSCPVGNAERNIILSAHQPHWHQSQMEITVPLKLKQIPWPIVTARNTMIVAACLLLVLWKAYTTPSPLEAALESYRRGNWSDAAQTLRRQLSTSEYEPAKAYLAETYVRLGQYSDAVDQILRNQSGMTLSDAQGKLRFPDGNNFTYYWADEPSTVPSRRFLHDKDYQSALSECDGYSEAELNQDGSALLDCALAFWGVGGADNLSRAEHLLRRATEIGTGTILSSAQCNLARLLQQSETDEVVLLARLCLEAHPNAQRQVHLGVLLFRRGNAEEASEALGLFRTAKNSWPEAREYLVFSVRRKADSLARQGQWSAAADLLKEARGISRNAPDRYEWDHLLVFCALHAGRWQLAENVLSEQPTSSVHYYWLATARSKRQNNAGAQEALHQALSQSPNDPWLQQALRDAGGQP